MCVVCQDIKKVQRMYNEANNIICKLNVILSNINELLEYKVQYVEDITHNKVKGYLPRKPNLRCGARCINKGVDLLDILNNNIISLILRAEFIIRKKGIYVEKQRLKDDLISCFIGDYARLGEFVRKIPVDDL